jgi:aspartyl aminopeptidase
MGGGVAIKHHANRNYITDGLTSALVSEIFARAGVKTQHFFMRSDLRCGSTLGTIAQTQTGIPGVDIGAPQLAMHSALETMALSDLAEYEKAITAFFATSFSFNGGAYVMKK